MKPPFVFVRIGAAGTGSYATFMALWLHDAGFTVLAVLAFALMLVPVRKEPAK